MTFMFFGTFQTASTVILVQNFCLVEGISHFVPQSKKTAEKNTKRILKHRKVRNEVQRHSKR